MVASQRGNRRAVRPTFSLVAALCHPPPFFVAGSLVLITILVYVPVLHCGFIWDDDGYILNNQTLRSTAGLGQIWFDFGATQDYYPLSFTTFWCEYQWWGLNPQGYHLDNVILHALNALIVYWLLVKLGVPGAAFAALIFAIHPVHVESVAWITERKNVLSGLFYFLSIAAFLRAAGLDQDTTEPGVPQATRLRLPLYFLSLGLFLLALLSKTVTVTLPLVLPVLVWWRTGRLRVRDLACVLPYFLVAAPIFMLGGIGDANFGGAGVGVLSHTAEIARLDAQGGGGRWDLTLVERLLLIGRVMWFYAGKLLVPVNLSFVYPRWTIDPSAWWQYAIAPECRGRAAGLLVIPPAIGARAAGSRPVLRSHTGSGVRAVQFLFPAVLLRRRPPAVSGEPGNYCAGGGPRRATGGQIAYQLLLRGAAGAAVIAVGLALLTISQQSCYRNLTTLWINTLEQNPASLLARVNLSVILRNQGRNEPALQLLEEGLPYWRAAP